MKTRVRLLGAALAVALVGGTALAQDKDYPIEEFERMTQCMTNPACVMEKEDRLDTPISESGPFGYQGVCLGGCVMLCTSEACWCEVDDAC